MQATITTTKEEVDYQFWYSGRNKVIEEYSYIKDNYSWESEEETELVYSVAKKNKPETNITSPIIYDLRTPQTSKRTKRETSKALGAVEEISRAPESTVDFSIISSGIPDFLHLL